MIEQRATTCSCKDFFYKGVIALSCLNPTGASNFIRDIVAADHATGKHGGRVVTRFPPEPNGYLHIGHAKSICLNFGVAQEIPEGICHLRFDDTNPTTEDPEYVQAIQDDVRWLGFDWRGKMFFASDYFEQLYDVAIRLIRKDKAYVDDLTAEEMRTYRGTLTQPGMNSPSRSHSVNENLDLFRRMRDGEFPDGTRVLRAKIDMSSPNINLRDPVLYRIRHVPHYRTGNAWCLYPSYDFAHPLSDAIEGITHSLCTLEFEDHRPLYDWVVEQAEMPHRPQQIEFARLNLTHTVMSKRKLLELVEKKLVSGWDDPRLPTIKGLRRRGYTPEVDSGLLRPYRRSQARGYRRDAVARTLCSRRSEQAVAASHGRIASAQNHPHQLSRGPMRRIGSRQ